MKRSKSCVTLDYKLAIVAAISVVVCFSILAIGAADTANLSHSSTSTLTQLPTPTSWFDKAWRDRQTILINNSGNSHLLTQYQVEITLSASNFDFGAALSDGSDIRVTDSDGVTLIPYYIQNFSTNAQTATIWVRIPTIPARQTKTIYLYYGNHSPARFILPPTGLFTRQQTGAQKGLAEDMVYDPATKRYYEVYSEGTSGPIGLSVASAPSGPWTKLGTILPLGRSGQWDSGLIYAPHLMLSNGIWYLYYSGGSLPGGRDNGDAIGVALASSVIGPYTKYKSGPLISSGNTPDSWDQYRACEPYVYYSSILRKWVMLYMGDAGYDSVQIEQVGYATAPDPLGPWEEFADNPIIRFSPAPAWDSGTVADPFAVEIGGTTYIGYTGATGKNGSSANWTIGFASTSDFRTFSKIGQVYGRGVIGEWDAQVAFRGSVSLFDNTWYLSYAGLDQSETAWRWNVATMSALSTARGYDPLQVFDYYDDFSNAQRSSALWGQPQIPGQGGSQTIDSHVMTIDSGRGTTHTLIGRRDFGTGYVIEITSRTLSADGPGVHTDGEGLALNGGSQTIGIMDSNTPYWIRLGENSRSASSTTRAMTNALIDTAWHVHRIAFVSSTLVLYQNDQGPWEPLTTQTPMSSLSPWLFSSATRNSDTKVAYSSVVVRKYANPEPQVTVRTA